MSGGQGEILTAFLFLQICIIFSFYFHFCKESKSSDGEMEKEIKDKKLKKFSTQTLPLPQIPNKRPFLIGEPFFHFSLSPCRK